MIALFWSLMRISFLSLLFAAIYLHSCAGAPARKELQSFIDGFQREVGVDASNVSVYFDKLDPEIAGVCILGIKIVRIDEQTYRSLSFIEQKALIYHELAHCACNLYGHAAVVPRHCQDSLMAPRMQSRYCYDKYWKKYIKDLKKRCK